MLRPPRTLVSRQFFDPTNELHLASLDTFIKTGNWGLVQFYPVLPYSDVPMTVLMTYASHMRRIRRETAEERQERWEVEKPDLVRLKLKGPNEERAEAQQRLESGNARLQELLGA